MKESGFNVISVEYLALKCYVQFMMLLRGFTVTCIKQTFYTSCHDGYYHHHPLDQTIGRLGLQLEAVHLLEDLQEAHEVLRHVIPALAADAG